MKGIDLNFRLKVTNFNIAARELMEKNYSKLNLINIYSATSQFGKCPKMLSLLFFSQLKNQMIKKFGRLAFLVLKYKNPSQASPPFPQSNSGAQGVHLMTHRPIISSHCTSPQTYEILPKRVRQAAVVEQWKGTSIHLVIS